MEPATILAIVLLVLGAIAAVSEIHTLTIYLLAVAVACFAAAAVAFAGAGLVWSLVVLAVVLLLGMPLAHWLRKRLRNTASEEVSHDDVGRDVTVLEHRDGKLRVSYRGAAWDARLEDPQTAPPAAGETCRIVAREGNRLVIATAAHRPS